MHFGHECDPGQMLAETIVQVLPDSPLFSRTYIEDCLFQVLSFCDVNPSSNDVLRCLPTAWKQGTRPCNQPLISMPRNPTGLVVLRKKVGTQHFKRRPEPMDFLRREKQVPNTFTLNLLH